MKREIKFRVWDIGEKRFVEDQLMMDSEGALYEVHSAGNEIREYFNDCVIQLYTGFKDKNGVEIYEGDIVMNRSTFYDLWETPGLYEDNKVVAKFVVQYKEDWTAFVLRNEEFDITEYIDEGRLEIVGNLFENNVDNQEK